MIEKLFFAFEQYGLLGVFALSIYGWGYPLTRWIPVALRLPSAMTIPFRLAGGLGVFIFCLIIFANGGMLKTGLIEVLLLMGIAINIWTWWAREPIRKQWHTGRPGMETWPWIALVTAVMLPLLIKPLLPPHAWDELAYHLPYARFWAEQGSLAINPWIRFPLMPYNMQLLYSAALMEGNDILPHLMNAFTAALTLVLLFACARRWMDWKTGVVAVVLLAFATRWGWSSANVDFGVMLFWTCAFAALAIRHESGDSRFLYLSALFAGLAIGVKYQALLYLPVFAALVLLVERRPSVLAKAVLVFLLVGSFWYLRNFMVSGNPVHPVAGGWFGYWIWNADDLAGLNSDLNRIRAWPPWYLTCAAATFVFWRSATMMQRTIMTVTAVSVGIWVISSSYPRYLTAIYPMLALLSAFLFVEIFRRMGFREKSAWLFSPDGRARQTTMVVLSATILIVAGLVDASKIFDQVIPDPGNRPARLGQQFKGYALMQSLPDTQVGVVYQLGFEGEFYYLGADVRGDWFGPGRYTDVMQLSENAPMLARHLEKIGADTLLINRSRARFSELNWDPEMDLHFELLGQTADASLYRLRLPKPQ